MGKVTGGEGWISLGPWGPRGWSQRSRSEASYKADGPVMEMTIHYNTESIDAISFQSESCDGVPIGCSEIIGSSHGKMTQKVRINSSVEQLLSISLTYNTFYMTSVTFHTNQNKYGPIGPFDEKDTTYSTPSDCGVIVGFHGCGDVDHNNRLLAIGIFVEPIVQSLHSIQDPNFGPSKDKREREREEMALPKFVVIKSASNKTYLQLPYGENTLLKFKELGSHSKGYKHEVEEAKSEAGLVHIKCCKTGKYWTLVGMHSNIIAAEADKPEEDGTSAACTLIKPTLKCIGGVTVVNFQFQRQSKWQSVFLNSMGCLESGENMAEDFIVSDWEKLRRPHPNKSTGTPTGGDAMVEGIEIDGVFIGGVEARGPGHLSVFGSSFGGGSSAGDGVSVADVNIKPSDVPVGGKFTFGKRTIKGGLRIGYPPIKEGVRTIKAGSAGDGVSVAGAGVGAYIHGVEEIGRSSKGMDTGDGGRGVGGESGGAGALAGVAASEGVGSGVRASEGADAGAEGEGAEGAPYIHSVEEIGRSSKGMDTSDGDIGNTYPTLATARQVCIELEKILTPPFQLSHLELIDWKDQERVQIVSQYDVLYKAALTADWDTAAKFLGQEPDAVFQPITWCLETALIVAVRSAKRNHFVKMVMEKMQREGVALIAQQDISGATALHAAVDGGNIEASVWLVQKNSELANIGDKDGTLAVHVAADHGNREMVDILLQHTTKLSETESGLKLLHSLASSGLYDIALTFLQRHPILASMKPSPLVVLAEKPTSFLSGTNFNLLERLIYSVIPSKLEDIANPNHTEGRDVIANENSTPERDIENHTQERDIANHPPERDIENPTQEREIENPCKCYECCCGCIVSALIHVRHKLCSVVRVHCFQKLTALFWDVAEKLVPRIKSIREIKLNHLQALRLVKRLTEEVVTETELRSATEIFTETVRKATCMGIHEIVEEICESFPRAIHLRSEKYRSLFHLAIAYRRENVFNLIYQMEENWHGILSMPDASTNNALHLAGNLRPQQQILLRASVVGAALQMQRELQWFEEVGNFILPQAKKEMNADGKTPQELFTETHKDLVTEGEQWMKDTANSCTIVAALITTIVFAAAITVPGGSFSDSGSDKKGLPIRLGGRAFTVFGVSDALAMFFSSSSLLMFLSILTCRYGEEDFRCSLPRRLIIGLVTLFLSIISMMVAFGATLKIVFGEKTAWIVIPVAILSCVPVALFALWQFPLLYAMIKSTYFPGIFGKKSNRILH